MQTIELEYPEVSSQWTFEVRMITSQEDKYVLCMIGKNFFDKNMRHLVQIAVDKSCNEQLNYAFEWCSKNPGRRLNETDTPKVYVDFGPEVEMERPAGTNAWQITGVSNIRIIGTNVPKPIVFPVMEPEPLPIGFELNELKGQYN